MGIIQKYFKKLRNMFHIPGEDVILIGLDDRNKSLRIYDLFVKTGSKFESKLESKVVEGNVAQVFLWYLRREIEHVFTGYYYEDNPNVLHIEFDIDKRHGCIFKTDDKPEGIAYLVDMQTGQGAQLIRKKEVQPAPEFELAENIIENLQIDPTIIIPKQIRLHRDPVIDMLVSINPFFWGSTIDSFIATELLRGKVEMWKMILFSALAFIFGLFFGMGM
jgi:hypothetical protein